MTNTEMKILGIRAGHSQSPGSFEDGGQGTTGNLSEGWAWGRVGDPGPGAWTDVSVGGSGLG